MTTAALNPAEADPRRTMAVYAEQREQALNLAGHWRAVAEAKALEVQALQEQVQSLQEQVQAAFQPEPTDTPETGPES
jgi:hypothetical protein